MSCGEKTGGGAGVGEGSWGAGGEPPVRQEVTVSDFVRPLMSSAVIVILFSPGWSGIEGTRQWVSPVYPMLGVPDVICQVSSATPS